MSNQPDVKFVHYRQRGADGTVSPRGGLTVAFVEQGDTIVSAVAKCHLNDNFNRKLGRIRSTGRLNSQDYATDFKGTRAEFLAVLDEQVALYNSTYSDQNLTRDFASRRPKSLTA